MRGPGILFFVLLMLSVASEGGDYHVTDKLTCSDCHSMHHSQEHTYEGTFGQGTPSLSAEPNEFLLRQPETQLCLACHDGQNFAPDVKEGNTIPSGGTDYVRAAGALTHDSSTSGDYSTANGHTLSTSDVEIPSSGGDIVSGGLKCRSCHDTHGNGNYRNLLKRPGTASEDINVTYKTGSYDQDNDHQAIQQSSASSDISVHYKVENIKYRRYADGSNHGLSKWCRGCHDEYDVSHLPAPPTICGAKPLDPPREFDSYYSQESKTPRWFDSMSSRVPVISASAALGTSSDSDNLVFCGSCHKGHGSTHPDGRIWDNRTSSTLEDGSSWNDTCDQCHVP